MRTVIEHRMPLPSDGEAILNALPNPVLLVAPDGKIVDANIAAESFFETSIQLLQRQLLKELKKIETALGRPPEHPRNRSRTIDLDLLYHGTRTLDEPDLQLPHPRLPLRGFVLHPLAEIRPELVLPGQTKAVRELTKELPHSPLVVRAAWQW